MAKRSMINCCVSGVPLPPYIKEQGEEAAGQGEARQGGVQLPLGVGLLLFLVGVGEGEGKGEEEKERGGRPLALNQFGLGLGGRAPHSPCFPLFPLRPIMAHLAPGGFR